MEGLEDALLLEVSRSPRHSSFSHRCWDYVTLKKVIEARVLEF